jgi:hypothetical protein
MKTVEWVMMVSFLGALVLSFYKLYLFFPKTALADDDTTPESIALLEQILVETDQSSPSLNEEELYQKMTEHPLFDSKHFWRFNENRLRHLIQNYRLKVPNFRL